MLTDAELATLMEDEELLDRILELKREFLRAEMDFLDVGDDDFVSLVLLAPSVGVALANGSISLFEELALNKKARSLSRGSLFMKKDPVAQMLKYLIDNFERWEKPCLELINMTLHSSLKRSPVVFEAFENPASSTGDLSRDILNAPYILVKFMSFMFSEEEDDLLEPSRISQVELKKIKEIGEAVGIGHLPVFQSFCESFILREKAMEQ